LIAPVLAIPFAGKKMIRANIVSVYESAISVFMIAAICGSSVE
jgi:hypothetical protein